MTSFSLVKAGWWWEKGQWRKEPSCILQSSTPSIRGAADQVPQAGSGDAVQTPGLGSIRKRGKLQGFSPVGGGKVGGPSKRKGPISQKKKFIDSTQTQCILERNPIILFRKKEIMNEAKKMIIHLWPEGDKEGCFHYDPLALFHVFINYLLTTF